jgi:hypothetical protein
LPLATPRKPASASKSTKALSGQQLAVQHVLTYVRLYREACVRAPSHVAFPFGADYAFTRDAIGKTKRSRREIYSSVTGLVCAEDYTGIVPSDVKLGGERIF